MPDLGLHRKRVAWCAFVGTVIFGLSVSQAAAIEPAIVEAAKKEGEVVWYTTLIVDSAVRPMVAAFEKKYPGMRVTYIRGDNTATVTRALNDARANRTAADVVDGTGVELPLRKAGLIAQWVPVEQAKAYPAEYKDPNHHWVAPNAYFLGPAYNTDLIRKGREPKSFEDLLDPRLKGKMVWAEGDGTFGALSFIATVQRAMGREKALAYLEKLAQQKIVVSGLGSRGQADLIIAGEYALGLQIFTNHAVVSAAKGAPIDWIPMSPLTGLISTMSLMKQAPHPNAGKLFFDFVLSEEGQTVLQQANYITTRPSIPALETRLKPAPGHFEATVITQEQQEQMYPDLKATFDRLFR